MRPKLPRTTADALGGLLIAIVIEMAFFAGYQSFVWYGTDTDFWWHLAVGRDVSTIGIPRVDTYSFTTPLYPWVAHSWLVDWLLYKLFHAFGATGTLVFAGVLDAGTIAATAWLTRRLGASRLAAAALSFVVLVLLFRFAYPRPQLVGFFLFAVELSLLERWVSVRDRSIYALPFFIVLWANLHASFVLGLAVPIGYFVAEGVSRALGLTTRASLDRPALTALARALAPSLAAPFLTPNGARLVAYILSKASQPGRKEHLLEWHATDITTPVGRLFALLIALALTLTVLRKPSLLLRDLGFLVVALTAGLSCIRYVPFASILLAAVSARALGSGDISLAEIEALLPRLVARVRARMGAPAPSSPALTIVVLAALAYGFDPRPRYREEADGDIPFHAVSVLGSRLLARHTLNDFEWGGYLIYRLGPEGRVFIDTRSDHFISTGVFEDYFAAVGVERRVDDVLTKYGIDHLFLRKGSPLLQYVRAAGRCTVEFEDAQSAFLDCDSAKPKAASGGADVAPAAPAPPSSPP